MRVITASARDKQSGKRPLDGAGCGAKHCTGQRSQHIVRKIAAKKVAQFNVDVHKADKHESIVEGKISEHALAELRQRIETQITASPSIFGHISGSVQTWTKSQLHAQTWPMAKTSACSQTYFWMHVCEMNVCGYQAANSQCTCKQRLRQHEAFVNAGNAIVAEIQGDKKCILYSEVWQPRQQVVVQKSGDKIYLMS